MPRVIGNIIILTELERFLGDTCNSQTLVKAITLIGNIGPMATSAAPALKKLRNNEQETVRQAAHTALEKISRK